MARFSRELRARCIEARTFAALALCSLMFWAPAFWASPASAEEAPAAYLKGRLLVASDSLSDSSFAKTVIYMIEHDATGALGLVVNRSVGRFPLPELFERLGLPSEEVTGSIRVHSGGPVEPGTMFILHSAEYLLDGSKEIGPNLALSNDPEILKAIGAGEGPAGYLFAFGYAGWAPGQLEGEISRGSWIDVPVSEELIFGPDDSMKWDLAVETYSIDL